MELGLKKRRSTGKTNASVNGGGGLSRVSSASAMSGISDFGPVPSLPASASASVKAISNVVCVDLI